MSTKKSRKKLVINRPSPVTIPEDSAFIQDLRRRSSEIRRRGTLKRAFTLIEILVVIGIIAVLAAIVLVAVNPARQFKLARDSQRVANVNAILNAIHQNMAEHRGIFTCNGIAKDIPNVPTIVMGSSTNPNYGGDIAQCVVPDYISSLPYDPSKSDAFYESTSSYDTDYIISRDQNGRITASSSGELAPSISVTR